MIRPVFKGTFLVVEGTSDCRLYAKFIDTDNVNIIVAHSKNTVIQAVRDMHMKRDDKAVIGFVDRDMDTLIGKQDRPPIFATDERDMETTILSSPALDDVLAEYGDRERMKAFSGKYGKIGEAVAKGACPVGLLMYVSYKKGMNLSFKDLDYVRFVSPASLRTDIGKLVAEVYASSMPQRYPRSAIADQLSSLCKEWGPSWKAARGHDAVAVLRIGLRSTFGSYNSRNLTDGELGGALRLAYSREYFMASELYRSSGEWCRTNGLALWKASVRIARSPRNPASSRRTRSP